MRINAVETESSLRSSFDRIHSDEHSSADQDIRDMNVFKNLESYTGSKSKNVISFNCTNGNFRRVCRSQIRGGDRIFW